MIKYDSETIITVFGEDGEFEVGERVGDTTDSEGRKRFDDTVQGFAPCS